MIERSSWLPDFSKLPDSKERRRLENLQLEMDLLMREQAETDDRKRAQELHVRVNEIWFEANATVGALFAKRAEEKTGRWRWRIEAVAAYLALFVAALSLFLQCSG